MWWLHDRRARDTAGTGDIADPMQLGYFQYCRGKASGWRDASAAWAVGLVVANVLWLVQYFWWSK